MPTRSGGEELAVFLAASAARSRVRQDLPRLDEEHRPGSGQRDMMGAAFQEADAQLPFQPLHLLAQRRLHDVLPLGRPAEVQLLRQRHEVAKLP